MPRRRIFLALMAMLMLTLLPMAPARAGGCAGPASYYIDYDGWGQFDYVVRFVIPRGANYRIVAGNSRTNATLWVSSQTNGISHYDTNIGRVVYVTAGLRARSAGGYFTQGGINDFARSLGIYW